MRFDLIILLIFLLCIAASDYKRVCFQVNISLTEHHLIGAERHLSAFEYH